MPPNRNTCFQLFRAERTKLQIGPPNPSPSRALWRSELANAVIVYPRRHYGIPKRLELQLSLEWVLDPSRLLQAGLLDGTIGTGKESERQQIPVSVRMIPRGCDVSPVASISQE